MADNDTPNNRNGNDDRMAREFRKLRKEMRKNEGSTRAPISFEPIRLRVSPVDDTGNDRDQVLRDRLELAEARRAAMAEDYQNLLRQPAQPERLEEDRRPRGRRDTLQDDREVVSEREPRRDNRLGNTALFGLLGLLALLGVGLLAYFIGRDNNDNVAAAASAPPPAASAPVCPPGMTCTPALDQNARLADANFAQADALNKVAAATNRVADAGFKNAEKPCCETSNRGGGNGTRRPPAPAVPTYSNSVSVAPQEAYTPGTIRVTYSGTLYPGASATGGMTQSSTGPATSVPVTTP